MDKRILYAVAAGGVGYLVYSLIKKKSADKGSDDTQDVDVIQENTSPNKDSGIANAYTNKVMALQSLLKVGVDGSAGKQTNGALENLFSSPPLTIDANTSFSAGYPYLKKNGKGVVTPSNVDYYIDAVKNKTTPTDLYYKSQASSKASTQQASKLVGDANTIKNAYAKGGILKSIRETKYNEVVQDVARNTWMTTGKTFTNSANSAFTFPEVLSRGNVKIVAVTKSGNLIVSVFAATWSSFGTTYLQVPASSVYVEK